MAVQMAMFTDKESFIESCKRFIDGFTWNLEREKATLEDELMGIGKEEFCKRNYILGDAREIEWVRHIEWRKGNIKYLERTIKKWYKKISDAEKLEVK